MELIFLIAVVALASWKLRPRRGAIDPASIVGPVASSPTTVWGVVAPLARAETRRVLLHPAFIVGVLLTPLMLLAATSDPESWRAVSGGVALGLVPLGWMTIIASNLVALRPSRSGTEELLAALPAPQSTRTGAMLATVVGPTVIAAVFAVASLVLVGRGTTVLSGSPEPLETLAGILIVAGAVTVGVAVARWLPGGGWGIAAVFVVIFLQARFLDVTTWPWNRPQGDPMRFIGFLAEGTNAGVNFLEFRPAGWHLVYLAALSVLMGGVALARDGLRRNVRILVGGALAIALAAGWIQTRPMSEAQVTARVSFLLDPAEHQVCEQADDVTYCAYQDFLVDVPDWIDRVGATLAALPTDARVRRPPLEVRQRPAIVISDSDCSPAGYLTTLTSDIASRIPVDDLWPADGAVHPPFGTDHFPCSSRGAFGFFLAVQTGAWAVGLPPAPHGANVRCVASGQARSAIALWAAAAASPDGERTLRDVTNDGSRGFPLIDFADWDSPPTWGVDYAVADAGLAVEMLGVAPGDVRDVLTADWDQWIDPATTTETLAAELGLPAPSLTIGSSSRSKCP